MLPNSERPSPIWVRLRMIWVAIRDSLWFIPTLFTLSAIVLAIGLIAEERYQWLPWRLDSIPLLGAGAEGAQQVLSSIASGLITVTGVVFSVTIVALQLASSQFTPRLLRNFTADRVNQLVLGVFIGTFTYALLVLGVIQYDGPETELFVPQLAVVVAMILVLVSIGFLIYFINHAAASMRVSIILERVTRQTLEQIEANFAHNGKSPRCDSNIALTWDDDQAAPVAATQAGYLTAVDARSLLHLGQDQQLIIRMECNVGQFLLPGQMLATVVPAARRDQKVAHTIRQAFVLGPERTPEQDIEFGIIEISDIAVKALSPGINDPTTAMRCIDHLSQILLKLGCTELSTELCSRGGQVHFIGRQLPFGRAVDLGFSQIQHYGATNPAVVKKLLAALCELIELVPAKQHCQSLIAQADTVLEEAAAAISSTVGQRQIDQLAADFRRLCGARRIDGAADPAKSPFQ